MNLTMAEQETTINYNRADDTMSIYSSNPNDIAYYDKMCAERPDWIKVVKTHGDYAKTYECATKKPGRLHPPRLVSDEERKKMSERMSNRIKSEAN